MDHPIIGKAIYARKAGFPEDDGAPKYDRSCIRETRFTLVRGCRTFVALDSEGVVLIHGILEPGGDKDRLVDDLNGLLRLLDSTAFDRRTLHLVRDWTQTLGAGLSKSRAGPQNWADGPISG